MVLNKKQALRLCAALIAIGVLAVPGAAVAQKTAPPSFVASPHVYLVSAQNKDYRIIRAFWEPGQRDKWHSHPEKGVFFMTNCSLRIYHPDGTHEDHYGIPAGYSMVQPPVASHEVENIGPKICKLVMFEPK